MKMQSNCLWNKIELTGEIYFYSTDALLGFNPNQEVSLESTPLPPWLQVQCGLSEDGAPKEERGVQHSSTGHTLTTFHNCLHLHHWQLSQPTCHFPPGLRS